MTLKDKDILNLPNAPDFISEEPHIGFNQMISMCEKMLSELNKNRYSKPDEEILGEPFVL